MRPSLDTVSWVARASGAPSITWVGPIGAGSRSVRWASAVMKVVVIPAATLPGCADGRRRLGDRHDLDAGGLQHVAPVEHRVAAAVVQPREPRAGDELRARRAREVGDVDLAPGRGPALAGGAGDERGLGVRRGRQLEFDALGEV